MTRSTRPATALGALFVLTALALGGCGRKGGLDLPPQTASTQPVGTATPAATADNSAAGKGSALTSSTSPADEVAAARGRKRSFVLDKLLD